MQVGDGAVVVHWEDTPQSSDGYDWIFWADEAAYANETTFLTDERAAGNLQHTLVNYRLDEVALFTDGLQRLALHYETRTAHAPFFEPMFAPLRAAANDGRANELSASLAAFLDSPSVNERTDDDKTLILATRRRNATRKRFDSSR